jgi:hypothetical protein
MGFAPGRLPDTSLDPEMAEGRGYHQRPIGAWGWLSSVFIAAARSQTTVRGFEDL